MYVPPDEPVQETGEINMNFQPDEAGVMNGAYLVRFARGQPIRQGGPARVEDGFVAAVNPIYQT